jgi:signal transduction histidine kinase
MRDEDVSHSPLVVLFDPESLSTDDHETALRSGGYRTLRLDDSQAARSLFARDNPAAFVFVEGRAGPKDDSGIRAAARELGIPVIGLVDHSGDGASLTDRVRLYDGWAHCASHASELTARLRLLLGKSTTNGQPPDREIPCDLHLLRMIVHDVRNPLNVIGLTLRVIEQLPEQQRVDFQEDLDFLRDNAGQIEKILSLLGDLCRMSDLGPPGQIEVDPRRFVREILAERARKGNDKGFPANLDAAPDTPVKVRLDPIRARLALLSALCNASTATDRPLSVRLSGGEKSWSIAIDVNRAPPATVVTGDVDPFKFVRVLASNAERRGLDLAISALLSAQFGGVVRIEVVPDQKSSIILDWPLKPY